LRLVFGAVSEEAKIGSRSAAPSVGEARRPVRVAAELVVRDIEVVYQKVVPVLRGVSLSVRPGEVVALLGPTGAGKTTLLRGITGLLRIHGGSIASGEIELDGESIVGHDPSEIVRSGVAQVMEGRRIFAELTVGDNLLAGAFTRRDRRALVVSFGRVFDLFPVLRERRDATAGYLSGGEQQMLAIGRALMAEPRLLVLDEPSLSLAPSMVARIARAISEINRQGTSVLLVEQNARMALSIADRGFVLESGRVVLEGTTEELRANREVQEVYLGVGRRADGSPREARTDDRREGRST
jgi:branched-chain amino acid transport system ATP-binding protein